MARFSIVPSAEALFREFTKGTVVWSQVIEGALRERLPVEELRGWLEEWGCEEVWRERLLRQYEDATPGAIAWRQSIEAWIARGAPRHWGR